MRCKIIKKYYVYILKCSDDTLYTGFTIDINKRLETHASGKGAKYTRGRLPVSLVYSEEFQSKSEALSREYYIKKLKLIDKKLLIQKKSLPFDR